jgi:SPW repeat-containing protein
MASPSARHRPSVRGDRRLRRDGYVAPDVAPDIAPAAETPPESWTDQLVGAAGLNVLAGIWLIIAPFVLGYSSGDPYWNDIVFGAIVAVLAAVRALGAYRQVWMSWLNMLIGAWLFASAFWLDQTATAAWNDVILGIVVFLLGMVAAAATPARRRRTTDPDLAAPRNRR